MKSFKEYLTETPYLINTIMPHNVNWNKPSFVSDNTIKRLFKKLLIKIETKLGELKVYQHNDKHIISGFIKKETNGEIKNADVLTLNFKSEITFTKPKDIKKEILQIDIVDIIKELEGHSIITDLYKLLLNEYIIASDETQFLGGKYIWKKLSREPDTYKIRIWNDKEKRYIKDANGNENYISGNFEEIDIWPDKTGEHLILIMEQI